jgi:hypothetical protein
VGFPFQATGHCWLLFGAPNFKEIDVSVLPAMIEQTGKTFLAYRDGEYIGEFSTIALATIAIQQASASYRASCTGVCMEVMGERNKKPPKFPLYDSPGRIRLPGGDLFFSKPLPKDGQFAKMPETNEDRMKMKFFLDNWIEPLSPETVPEEFKGTLT